MMERGSAQSGAGRAGGQLAPDGQVRQRAMRGSALTMVEYLFNNGLRFVSNLVLAHALFPEAFAIVAYASIVLQGLTMLSDFGIGPAIVQSPRGSEPDFLNTAWTIQIVRGLVLFSLSVALGWPMALIYNEPQLAWIVPACGLNFIVTGFHSTNVHTCQRAMVLGRYVLIGMIEASLKAAVTIIWALVSPSVWALVWGSLVGYIVGAVLTHVLLPGIRNRFRWERPAVRELGHFGGWVLVSTFLTFCAGQADRLILGKLVAMSVVGVYSISLMFVRLPIDVASRLAQLVLFPALANVARNDLPSFRHKLLESRGAILAIAQLGIVIVIIGSPWFFGYLYDARYHEAAVFSPFLGGAIWFQILWVCSYPALLAIGDPRTIAFSNFANFLVTVVGCLVGFHLDGMRGFIFGIGAGNLAGYAVVSWALGRRGLAVFSQDFRFTVAVAACALGAHMAPSMGGFGDSLPATVGVGLLFVAISVLVAWRQMESLLGKAFGMVFRRGH